MKAPPQLAPEDVAPDDLGSMLSRIAAGDMAEFSSFYAATSPRIYSLVLRILRCPDQSAEVTQEVYLQVWRQAPRYDPTKGSAMAWVVTLAHRRAVDRVRTVQAASARDDAFHARTTGAEFDEVWEDVARRSESDSIRAAVAQLSVIQRQALMLTYFGGHTAARVAAMLGVPVSTVKTRIRDGLKNLRRILMVAPAGEPT